MLLYLFRYIITICKVRNFFCVVLLFGLLLLQFEACPTVEHALIGEGEALALGFC